WTTVEKAYPEPTLANPCIGDCGVVCGCGCDCASLGGVTPAADTVCSSTNTDTVAKPSEYTRWLAGEAASPRVCAPWTVNLKPGGSSLARYAARAADAL